MSKFAIGAKWIVYGPDSEDGDVHTILGYEQSSDSFVRLITEHEGQRFEWLPSVLECVGEPA